MNNCLTNDAVKRENAVWSYCSGDPAMMMEFSITVLPERYDFDTSLGL
jgi:hypothetical protein